MNIELKPCPFCGGEAEMMGDQYPYVECHECGAGFTANHSYNADEDDAASNWNSRRFGQDKMKRIAEKKIEQLGGDACGVLVRKDARLAAVDEHGRVQWLQDGQGAEPVAWLHQSRPETDVITDAVKRCWGHILPKHMQYSIPLYTQPQPAQQGGYPDCDTCGRAMDYMPWHYATKTERHRHACNECWPKVNPAQQGVPEGWKLVPVEPTAAMISAFEHAPCAENYTDAATWAWEAMLDVVPQPPQEGE